MRLSAEEARRVVYVSPYYDPGVHSGANRRFEELVRRFERDFGNNFTLIVCRGKAPTFYQGPLIEVDYRFDHRSKFTAAREIGRALDALPPSIVICESIPIPFRALKRHAHFQVAYDFRYFTGDSKGWLYRLVFSPYLKWQWGSSEWMVTCSDFSIAELKKYVGYDSARVVKSYFGIDEHVLDLVRQPAPAKTIDLIYVAHFEKRKNHGPLLEAIALLDKNLRCVFIGRDNGLLTPLSARAKELGLVNTTFSTTNIPDAELWQKYRESRVFAYPSVYEGFGIPLIEAIGLHIPVACADVPVFHEVGADFPAFFEPYNPADIKNKLAALLANPTIYDDAQVRSHLQKFFWENIYNKFVDEVRRAATTGA